MNLRPLHNLYQTISPASLLENEEPLIAISKLQRKGNTPSGDIQWVIGVGTQAEQEIWWETRLNASEIEGLSNQLKDTAITREMMVEGIRTNWNEGRLDVQGFEGASFAKERKEIQLVIYFMKQIPISITLSPVDRSPLSLLSIMAHIIPPYISSSSSQAALESLRPELAASNQERDKLQLEATLLREEVKELRKRIKEGEGERRNGKRARTVELSQSQSGGASQSQSGRGTSASVSPQKKGRPGIDYKAVMKPGTKGYAGSSNRVGRNLDDEWEEPDSD